MRLNRYISASGAASRRKGEDIIRDGRITVNGEIVTDPARNVDSECDKVLLDGIPLVMNPEKRFKISNEKILPFQEKKIIIDIFNSY